MNSTILDQHKGKLITQIGACYPGEKAIFRGQDLHTELTDIEWFDLYIYGITGRRLDPNKLKLLQTLWTYTSYPDSRIWNNRVASLAATTKSTVSLGCTAGLSVSEAEIFGRGIDIKAITFLVNTLKKIKKNYTLDECVKDELKVHRGIAGYGRPLSSKDERIDPILEKAKSLKLADGAHLKLAFDIDKFLNDGRWRLKINYAAVSAALAADIGLTPLEYYQYALPAFLAGMIPCHIEASEKPAGTLFPTPCKDIHYTGPEKRAWKNK